MKFCNPLIVVKDMDQSLAFYKNVLGCEIIQDFGANKTLTGGIVLQTQDTYKEFIDNKKILFGGNNVELYFEEDNFDAFLQKLKTLKIEYVHPVKEHTWGQRVVRFYDPDSHIIEVGENNKLVCLRFYNRGMSIEEVAKQMDVPLSFVQECISNEINFK